jgi:hypothetical protein
MRYDLFNECITVTKETGVRLRFDGDPLNIRENTADFTTISEVLHSEAHDVQQRVTFVINEEMYSLA